MQGLYVDIQTLLGDWLIAHYPELAGPPVHVWVDADPPPDAAMRLGVVHLTGLGGGAAAPAMVSPTVDIDVYGSTVEQARALTRLVFDAVMVDLPNTDLGDDVVVTKVGVLTYPGTQPYDQNSDIRRMAMAFGLTLST